MDLKVKILLIEDEEFDVRRVKNTIKPYSHFIEILSVVSDGNSAIQLIENNPGSYDVIIMDYQIAGNISGEKLIRKIKQLDPLIQIIVITKMTINLTDYEFAQKLVDAGAMWYCTKYPGDIEEFIYQPTDFLLSIMNAYEKKRLTKEKMKSEGKLKQNINKILEEKELVGRSEAIEYIKMQINNVAATDATIVIRGESGTGKELVATRVHYLSNRKFENFVPINCGSIPKDLIESELFGYEKGAFTGASSNKPGLFELANKGTIFLDEIAELPLEAQVKLLRVLQEGEIDKIGRKGKRKVDVRVIVATNKDLEEEVRKGNFREDLYYRINVFTIWLPTLRERSEDIPVLVHYFLRKFAAKMGRIVPKINDEAIDILKLHNWPGNIRELQNVIQRLLLAFKSEITPADIEMAIGKLNRKHVNNQPAENYFPIHEIRPLREIERDFRKQYIQLVMKKTESDAEAARLLGLAPSNYHRLLKKIGIK
jgi:DNA-binding NtrC family response regulator